MLRPGSRMISAAGREVRARGLDGARRGRRRASAGGRRRCSAPRARRRGRRRRTSRAARSRRPPRRTVRRRGSATRRGSGCRAARSRGLASMRRIAAAASVNDRPNFDPECPVSTWAWVSAVTSGITRTRTSWRRPAGTCASSRSMSSVLSTTTVPSPTSTASAISSSSLALPCSTRDAGSAPAAIAVMISPPPATSRPSPSSTMTRWIAVHGKDFEAKTTRDRRPPRGEPFAVRPGAGAQARPRRRRASGCRATRRPRRGGSRRR